MTKRRKSTAPGAREMRQSVAYRRLYMKAIKNRDRSADRYWALAERFERAAESKRNRNMRPH